MDRHGDDPQTGYPQTGYMEDFFAWTQDQAAKLRAAAASGSNLPVDWENLAEEIESVGRSDYRALESLLTVVIEHLLKLEHSPAADPRAGWSRSVRHARRSVDKLLRDSPSFRRRLPEAVADAWPDAADNASEGLEADDLPGDSLPETCPYTVEQVLDVAWLPVNRHGLS
jgi:hypothetical protein